ncbi:hypothetical protein ACF09Y_02885 [Streptomyces massasporeus]|uniref:hypothetical protein n=1 Tax=Streptomyces massasporeus TaxID=67324 RepID=UPI00167A2506|nr:hypothetical protein [Streptomyces massasporeus]
MGMQHPPPLGSPESGVLEVNEKRKLKIFATVSGVISVAALIQGSLTEGSGKIILITLGMLGIIGIGMLTYAMKRGGRSSQ